MANNGILVLGGTGKTGRRLVGALRARGAEVRAASRSGEVRFDWDDRSTWAPAFTGVRAAYVVDLQDKPGQWDAETQIRALAEQAVAQGVERLVLLQARVHGLVGGKDLKAGEGAVRESGAEWTILRPNWFFQNFDEGVLFDAVLAGELRLPAGQGREPFVDAGDVAEVAAAALLEDGHQGQILELSGPASLSLTEAAALLSEASGREIRYVPVDHQEYVDELVSYEVPADYALFVADLVAQIRDNRNTATTPTVERILGRPPRDFADFAKSAAADGAWQE
ncbi:NmrA family protein [Streptomyces albus]|uniref:NmrA family protein n=1 Tax=Streptomyces albus (strain ATCC 21838 / DSM 41398 / FERM P-419 / JCM 4703 / NBRC 107858) TaxID=1081613 RepID=A0A0B5ELX1_STRA4|nr:NmrA family protein [Streptomyces albus]AOU76893.1 NmrA family protein [Streptomyces albus]AYN32671.1 NmrA family protein [Streptomyces albus]